MMTLHILAFGIAKDILGTHLLSITSPENISIADLKQRLILDYPAFKELLTFSIAVNNTYQNEDCIIKEGDEIAIIPPVSGG